MTKQDDAIRTLHELAQAAVYEQAPWPCSRKTCETILKMLERAGLKTPSPQEVGLPGAFRLSPEIDVLLRTIGVLDPWDLPTEISEEDLAAMEFAPTEAEALEVIRRVIFSLYKRRYQQ